MGKYGVDKCLSIFLVIAAAALITIENLNGINADDAADAAAEAEHCKALITDAMKRGLKEMGNCSKALGYKTKAEKREKAACVMKCVATNIGLLGDDGKIDEEASLMFVMENVPPKYQDKAIGIMVGCMEHAGKVNPAEANCKSYEPMFHCVQDSAVKFAKLCADGHL